MNLQLLLLCALLTAAPAFAIMRNVPAQYSTIQEAILASGEHDTVRVAPGTYPENINFWGRNIVVGSHFLDDRDIGFIRSTILDGSTPDVSDSGSVVLFISGEDSTAELAGFTLTGGTGTKFRDQSDGLFYVEGGAVLIENGNPFIHHNFMWLNEATRRPQGVTSAGGGAIRTGFGRGGTIANNVILENEGRYGGGIVAFFASPQIRNNIIALNSGGQDFGGGGVWVGGTSSNCRLENNTIVANSTSGGRPGGGIRQFGGNITGTNNIVWGNRASSGAQISGTPNATRLIYGAVQGGYAGVGNIAEYPLFADSLLELLAGSPCINAGNDSTIYNDADGTRNDMGAYGGPINSAFVLIASATIYANVDAIDFGDVHVGDHASQSRALENRGLAPLVIDSVVTGDTEGLTIISAPNRLGPVQTDSLRISWEPPSTTPLIDTVRIYHRDSATPNPLIIPLAGTALDAPMDLPVAYTFDFEQNYPNPFNGSTLFVYTLEGPESVQLDIIDVTGRLVERLVDERAERGTSYVYWRPAGLASGIYFARLTAGHNSAIHKLFFIQ